jgi:hypothetical protein
VYPAAYELPARPVPAQAQAQERAPAQVPAQAPQGLQYADEMRRLVVMGFNEVARNRDLLHRHKGNMDAVLEVLLGGNDLAPDDDDDPQQGRPPPDGRANWSNELASLARMGLTNTAMLVQLLDQYNGNIDVVAGVVFDNGLL